MSGRADDLEKEVEEFISLATHAFSEKEFLPGGDIDGEMGDPDKEQEQCDSMTVSTIHSKWVSSRCPYMFILSPQCSKS